MIKRHQEKKENLKKDTKSVKRCNKRFIMPKVRNATSHQSVHKPRIMKKDDSQQIAEIKSDLSSLSKECKICKKGINKSLKTVNGFLNKVKTPIEHDDNTKSNVEANIDTKSNKKNDISQDDSYKMINEQTHNELHKIVNDELNKDINVKPNENIKKTKVDTIKRDFQVKNRIYDNNKETIRMDNMQIVHDELTARNDSNEQKEITNDSDSTMFELKGKEANNYNAIKETIEFINTQEQIQDPMPNVEDLTNNDDSNKLIETDEFIIEKMRSIEQAKELLESLSI